MNPKMIVLLLLSASVVRAQVKVCPKNCYEFKGECACDLVPLGGEPVKPSNEKPPKEKMPSYQREGINALMPESLANKDRQEDDEKESANKEGRKAAGIKEKTK